MNPAPNTGPSTRWRAPIVMLLLVLIAMAWTWLFSGLILQLKILAGYVTVLLMTPLATIWLLFFSRLPWRKRLAPVAFLAVSLGVVFSLAEIRGVTGDWLPVWQWRWQDNPEWSSREAREPHGPTDRGELVLASPASFTGFLGPHGNSTVTGLSLASDWERNAPKMVWQRRVGTGWSGFAIAGGSAFTLEQRGDLETLVAYDLESGEEQWSSGEASYFSNPIAGPGPRSTPTVSAERIFTLGARGLLSAFERSSGRLLWQHDVIAEHDSRVPEHGMASSPILVDDLVVVSAGGRDGHSMVAYQQANGALAWHAGSGRASYATPSLATLLGERQIIAFNAASVAGHRASDGEVLWEHDWPADWPNVASPVALGPDRILFSTGYGIGSKMIRLSRQADGSMQADLDWESPRMKSKFGNLVLHEEFIYGLDDGVLVCLDPETGERRWKRGRYGHGNLLLVDDLLLVQTEKGDIVMIEPTPEEHQELGRFTALRGKAWNHFAVVEPYLLVRNDLEAALWKLPLR